ncbi:MAG: hypothetical protein PHP50_12565 [Lachnospiraceae bacterium]|nr:hypothetical protein [Lachnospiraceae bacterium]
MDYLAFAGVIICGILCYILYSYGYITVQTKRALMYIGTVGWGRNLSGAKVKGCTGHTRRVIRFPESRVYHFLLEYGITDGSVVIEIKSKDKQELLVLDQDKKEGSIMVEANRKYYLVVSFQHADGKYEVTWQ